MSTNVPGLIPRQSAPSHISLVVPCHNEAEVFAELRSRLRGCMEKLGLPYEIVLIDDGSRDSTWDLICQAQNEDPHIKAIRLSRNYGHQIAITCGLDQTRGEVVVILDADLQDPPELIPEMLARWRDGYDVVYGKRRSREGESYVKRFLAYSFYRVFERIIGIHVPSDTGDFRLMSRRAVTALQALKERHRFVRGMVSWIGFHQTPVFYDRPERFAGESKYPFRKSLFLAIDAITSFSYAPLRLASYLGLAISGFAFLYIIVILLLRFYFEIYEVGWTSIMASTLLLGGIQLIVLGIMGEYIGRIFEQGQHRPLYLIDQIRGEPLSSEHAGVRE